MSLTKKDFEAIGEYVKENISNWLTEKSLGKPLQVYEIELRERMIRVEEELKNQRILMNKGFEHNNKRFEDMNKHISFMFKVMVFGFTVISAMIGAAKFIK